MNEIFKEKELNGGVQRLYRFDNDYGASVICHRGSYGYDQGLWELAVIRFTHGDSYVLDYSTHITDDVIGHLTPSEIDETLVKIQELPKIEK